MALAVAAPRQTLPNPATTKRVSTIIPMGKREDIAPDEIDDAPPSGPAQADEAHAPPSDLAPADVAQSSSGSPASAEVAQSPSNGLAPETVGDDLTATFARQYQAVCKIDEAVAHLEIKKRRTPEYWELGRIAAQLKEKLGHGKWGTS